MYEYLEGLNNAQRAAVENYKGPSLVIAGAGSGKTRVLTFRITHLLRNDVPANKILALTFTNKAASEMKERIASVVGQNDARHLWMGTFHSIFARILRREAEALGYSSSFTIYDALDTKNLIKKICKELGLDDKLYKPNDVYSRISSAKNNLITPQAYIANGRILTQDNHSKKPRLGEIYNIYAKRCKDSDAMDFDDLLLNTNILFRDHPEVLAKYQDQFHYILVDEYQDTNFSQYLIIKKLSQKRQNICVVGDDAQSIYAFRGAKIENILNFQSDYPKHKLFKLEQNYRSTQTIVDAANSIIKKNSKQLPKKVFSENAVGDPIQVVDHINDKDEAHYVAQCIQQERMDCDLEFKDFAILYRTNSQSRNFEEALRRYNIPYKVYGSISFYQRKEIKDILAYFRTATNPKDEEAITRIINYPARGIGQTTISRVVAYAQEKEMPLWELLAHIGGHATGIQAAAANRIIQFVQLIHKCRTYIEQMDAFEAAHRIAIDSGILKDLYNPDSHEDQTKYENVEELLNGIKDYVENFDEEGTPTLDRFIENVALLTNADNENDDDNNKTALMTVHSAKGLEFKHVFLAGIEEDLFPSKMSSSSLKDLEEERRLFYVALTRAEQRATITYAKERYKWGMPTPSKPSRFIKEIDEKYLDLPEGYFFDISPTGGDSLSMFEEKSAPRFQKSSTPKRHSGGSIEKTRIRQTPQASVPKKLVKLSQAQKKLKQQGDPHFQADDPALLKEQMRVRHSRFGEGTITSIEGETGNQKAKVVFVSGEEKTLLLKFAKLQIIKS